MNQTNKHHAMSLGDINLRIHEAVQFHQTGRIKEAMEIYGNILDVDPGHSDALHLQGFAAHQLNQNRKAMDLISQAIQICPECAVYHNSLGMVLKDMDKPSEAISSYQKALALDPNLVESYNNLGVLLQGLGRLEEAAPYFEKALAIRPDTAEIQNNLGNLNQALHRMEAAIPCYQKALEIDPDYAEAHYNMGNAFQGLGKPDEASQCYYNALKLRPDYPEAFYNLGNAYQAMERPDRAVKCYQNALLLDPESIEITINLAIAFTKLGDFSEAVSVLKNVLSIDPDSSEAYYYLGTVLQHQGKFHEAMASYKKALALNPENPDACHNMGILYQEQGRLNLALTYYNKTLALKPDYAEAYHNLGTTFQGLAQLGEAVECFRKALELDPRLSQTYVSMGNALKEDGKLTEAWAYYKKALEKDPDNAKAYSHLVHQARETCDWNMLDDLVAKLDSLTNSSLKKGEKVAEMPFLSLMKEAHPSVYLAIAQSRSRDIAEKMSRLMSPFSFKDRIRPKRKITVGYLSNTFRNHPGSHLILGLLKLHNREQFNVFCYSYGEDDGSYYRKRIQQDCDRFVELRDISHTDAAMRIFEDQVDILVDLRGHTKGNRFISALRPAPVQVFYLGYPATTGADFYDYMITDKIVTPESHAPYYSENFAYMPYCYQINDHEQLISDRPWHTSDFNIPENSFVFCSFNGPFKIEPVMFDAWMRILQRVPESILWLLKVNDMSERNLRHEASVRGVGPERIVFSAGLPKEEHLARFRLAHLALDTRIVNGHTTTSDALWAGVPVITLKGEYFPSRVSASILNAVCLPELITHSMDEYETLAVYLANHPDKLNEIKHKLAKYRLSKPLFDTPRFVQNLERVYWEMWKIMLAGNGPRQIEITDP